MEKRKINTTARGVDTQANIEDSKIEGSLRPKSLDNYIGQKKIKECTALWKCRGAFCCTAVAVPFVAICAFVAAFGFACFRVVTHCS